MKRRDFLTASALAGAVPLAATAATLVGAAPQAATAATAGKEGAKERQYIEIRKYNMLPGDNKKRLGDFLKNAAVPAWNRLGIQPVGLLTPVYGPDSLSVYAILPHPSLECFATASSRLLEDAEFLKAGAEFLDTSISNPGYVRIESSLLAAFDGMPKIEIPKQTKDNKPRIFEIRIYESHSLKAGKLKVKMFNSGEIAIFRKTGLQPVLFGEALSGTQMPNLIYMVCFDDMAARDANWKTFSDSPEWTEMKNKPEFKDTVSRITDLILKPAGGSQI